MSRDITIRLAVEGGQEAASQIEDVNAALADTKKTAPDVSSAFSGLSASITGMIGAYAGLKGIQAVAEMVNVGQEVNRVSAIFNTMTASIGGSADVLARLQNATDHTVDNMALMGEANRVLSYGIVSSSDELERMAKMADNLNDAMGGNGADALQRFANIISTGRIAALKDFGINVEDVRQKIKAFTDTGMSMQDAIKAAVFDAGTVALQKFGSAVDAADTPVQQLQTTWKNFWDNFDARVASGINGLISLAQFATGATPQQAAQQQQISDQAAQIIPLIQKGMDIQGNLNPVLDFVHKALQAAAADPSLASDAARLSQTVLTQMGMSADQLATTINPTANPFGSVFDSLSNGQLFEQMASGVMQYKGTLDQATNSATKLANATASVAVTNALMAGVNVPLMGGGGLSTAAGVTIGSGPQSMGFATSEGAQAAQAARARQLQVYTWVQDALRMSGTPEYGESYFQGLNDNSAKGGQNYLPQMASGLMTSFMSNAAPTVGKFGTQAQADQLKAQYESMTQSFQHLQDLNKAGLISDADISKAQALDDSFKSAADSAQKAADNLKNMALTDFTGQTSGGLQGQIEDKIIAAMQASGRSKKDIAATQTALDMQSGRQTETSQALDTAMKSLAGLDAATMAKAVSNLTQFMQLSMTSTLTDKQKAQGLGGAVGFTGDMNAYIQMLQLQAQGVGQGGGMAPTNSFGFSSDGKGGVTYNNAAVGGPGGMKDMQDTTKIVGDNVTAINTGITQAKTNAQAFADALKSVPTLKNFTVKLVADDPQNLLGLLANGGTLNIPVNGPSTAGSQTGTMVNSGGSGNRLTSGGGKR